MRENNYRGSEPRGEKKGFMHNALLVSGRMFVDLLLQGTTGPSSEGEEGWRPLRRNIILGVRALGEWKGASHGKFILRATGP